MRLPQYIQAVDGSESAFARRAKVPQTTVHRICKGGGCNIETAAEIVRATHARPTPSGGVVTFEELVPSEETAA